MKLLTAEISIFCLLSTLCVGTPVLGPSNGVSPILFPDPPIIFGSLIEPIYLPAANIEAEGYILLKVRLPLQDTVGLGFRNWVLLAAKYRQNGLPVEGSPIYILQARKNNGVWVSGSTKFEMEDRTHELRSWVEKYQPIAWVPENGVEGMVGELLKVRLDGLPNDVVEGKMGWIARVIESLQNGQQQT
ncbi:MAG: hypothetical protein M1829_002890 [Trizodia sp. TS-e1964]|nr:MAG: hypothetical protein M1829_002890 [Trizodia sp. TS-e1964]